MSENKVRRHEIQLPWCWHYTSVYFNCHREEKNGMHLLFFTDIFSSGKARLCFSSVSSNWTGAGDCFQLWGIREGERQSKQTRAMCMVMWRSQHASKGVAAIRDQLLCHAVLMFGKGKCKWSVIFGWPSSFFLICEWYHFGKLAYFFLGRIAVWEVD